MADLLAGRSAVVTGGSRGIGLAIARRLGAASVRVFIVARESAALERAAGETGAVPLAADVADADAVSALAARVAESCNGGPDIVVNAAGAFGLARLADTAPADFDRMIAVNLRGAFLMIRAFLPGMLERGSGHVVSIGSISGRQAFPANGAYSASKFGLRGMHAVLDQEVRGTGVRSTLVEPAATDTALWDPIDRTANPGLPVAEAMLSADDVAECVHFALARPAGVAVRNLFAERS